MITIGRHTDGKPLELPDDAITQATAVIGRRGSGKTYTATVLIEQIMVRGGQVIAVDPVGNMHGLQVAADGKAPSGLNLVVFGGEHSNVPLYEGQGKALATLIIERNLSAVIDVSGMLKNARKRFMADFGEQFFHLAKTHRAARLLVLEEAQLFVPQSDSRGQERMIGAITDIVRLGRNYGLGSMLITQRPQSVSKEVLNQCELLILGQLSGPHERKAIEGWVVEHGSETAKETRKWLLELPSLPTGTAMVWSPSWLKIFAKVTINKKTTWDTSSTPVMGVAAAESFKPRLAYDLDELQNALCEADEPGADVPKKPTSRGTRNQPAPAQPTDAERVELATLRAANEDLNAITRAMSNRVGSACFDLDGLIEIVEGLGKALHLMRDALSSANGAFSASPRHEPESAPQPPRKRPAAVEPADPALTSNAFRFTAGSAAHQRTRGLGEPPKTDLPGKAVLMLRQLARVYPTGLTRRQLGTAVGMKARGGTFASYLAQLNVRGLLEKSGDTLRPSAPAFKLLNIEPAKRASYVKLSDFWADTLQPSELRMLEQVTRAKDGLARDELARALNMEPRGGTFASRLSVLHANRLIVKKANRWHLSSYLLGQEHAV